MNKRFLGWLLLTVCVAAWVADRHLASFAEHPQRVPQEMPLLAQGECFWGKVVVSGHDITIGGKGQHHYGEGHICHGKVVIVWDLWAGPAAGVYALDGPNRMVGEWWYLDRPDVPLPETIEIRSDK